MDHVFIQKAGRPGDNFIPAEYLPEGKDDYYLRDIQTADTPGKWRHLMSFEIEKLVRNGNTSENWDDIHVTDSFMPDLVRNNDFSGRVRIGRLENDILKHHDFRIPAGITNSRIIACDIGDDTAIHNVHYLSHFITGNRNILLNIGEMHTTHHARFGNGILKEGEPEDSRIWLELINETGSRRVMPFDGMIPADAWLWARYRDDYALQEKLRVITQQQFDARHGFYGTTGDQCVIRNCRILKDIRIGSHCYINGANKLKNLTVNSSAEEPTRIGEGVELVNGIIGCGCQIFYGCKAVHFLLGSHASLKYGARLIHSFLGDNSTISCCEVLNSLIFPAHEQHHNNSFLIASIIMGQSNIAAGATVGSNHNSRANDNELLAGRGFWPGLCTSVKHSSRFASFVLLAKGDYPAELDIPFPFSLLNNNTTSDILEVMPAFWWLYNMYALTRNTWKFRVRDKRKIIQQFIEYNFLAPDTVEEILKARRLLEIWTARAYLRQRGEIPDEETEDALVNLGWKILENKIETYQELVITGENMEKSRRPAVILNYRQGYRAYGDMLYYYAVKNCLDYLVQHPGVQFSGMASALAGVHAHSWVNLGGQLIPESSLDRLRADIGSGALDSWDTIHNRYHTFRQDYPFQKQQHAFAVLTGLLGTPRPGSEQWQTALNEIVRIQEYICDQVYLSRKKDYDNPFRRCTYRTQEEMTAAVGTIEDNSFIKQMREETTELKRLVAEIRQRG